MFNSEHNQNMPQVVNKILNELVSTPRHGHISLWTQELLFYHVV